MRDSLLYKAPIGLKWLGIDQSWFSFKVHLLKELSDVSAAFSCLVHFTEQG